MLQASGRIVGNIRGFPRFGESFPPTFGRSLAPVIVVPAEHPVDASQPLSAPLQSPRYQPI